MAADLLSTICREIDERLSELRPLLAEYEQLLSAVDALLAAGSGDSIAISRTVVPEKKAAVPGNKAAASGEAAVPGNKAAASGEAAVPGNKAAASGEAAVPGNKAAASGEAAVPGKPIQHRTRVGATRRGSAAGAIERAAGGREMTLNGHIESDSTELAESIDERQVGDPPSAGDPPSTAKPERAARGAAREAILAALEHGSHTVGELAVVTAMSAPNINGNVRKLVSEGAVVKIEREGKAAWALPEVVR